MISRQPGKRRAARFVARTGTAASAAMLAFSVWALGSASLPPAFGAATAGVSTVVKPVDGPDAGAALSAGGSLTPFTLKLPAGAACTGDSTNANYRVQSYIVPVGVDPAALTFGANGPIRAGSGASFPQPLFRTTSNSFVNEFTAASVPPAVTGQVINIPAFDFGVFVPGDVAPGTYNLGIACTLGPASTTQVDRFWNAQMVVATATADTANPAGITWTAAAAQTTTTTSSITTTTTTTGASTTSTALSGTTTSSSVDTTTTTVPDAGTTTTQGDGSASPFSGSTSGGAASVGALPRTGEATPLVVWSAMLVIFGRMAILLGRTPKVRA